MQHQRNDTPLITPASATPKHRVVVVIVVMRTWTLCVAYAAPISTTLTTAEGQGADAFVLGLHTTGGGSITDRSTENFGSNDWLNNRWNTHPSAPRYSKSYFRFDLPQDIAGFEAEKAATHNLCAAQTGPREFVLAHSEIDRIHQRHLTGENKNYVGGFITRWRIDSDGSPQRLERCNVPPFYGTKMAPDGAGGARLVCRQAGEGDPLHLYTIQTTPAP